MEHPKSDSIRFVIPFTGVDTNPWMDNRGWNRQLEDGDKVVLAGADPNDGVTKLEVTFRADDPAAWLLPRDRRRLDRRCRV